MDNYTNFFGPLPTTSGLDQSLFKNRYRSKQIWFLEVDFQPDPLSRVGVFKDTERAMGFLWKSPSINQSFVHIFLVTKRSVTLKYFIFGKRTLLSPKQCRKGHLCFSKINLDSSVWLSPPLSSKDIFSRHFCRYHEVFFRLLWNWQFCLSKGEFCRPIRVDSKVSTVSVSIISELTFTKLLLSIGGWCNWKYL